MAAFLASLDHDSALYALTASPDRRLIAVGGTDRFVMILDADTLAVKHRFRAHDATISAACFHPTLPLLATGSADHSLKLWRYADATLLQTFTAIEGLPRSLTFSPNGKLLATDGRDRAVRVFEVTMPLTPANNGISEEEKGEVRNRSRIKESRLRRSSTSRPPLDHALTFLTFLTHLTPQTQTSRAAPQ